MVQSIFQEWLVLWQLRHGMTQLFQSKWITPCASPIVVLTTWRSYEKGGLKDPKLSSEDPWGQVLKQMIYESIVYTLASLSFCPAGSQQYQLSSNLLNPSRFKFYFHLLIDSFNYFLLGTNYLPGTVLGAEDTTMKKVDNGPAFMKINSDEG